MLQPTPQYGHSESTFLTGVSGSTVSVSGLSMRAPVGQAAMHSPHDTQLDWPIGKSLSNAIRAVEPLPARPMTSLHCTSSQARMQRSHMMQALWFTWITADETSCPGSNGRAGKRGA